MKPKSDGIRSYIKTTVDIYFPFPGGMSCQYCPLLETYSRNMCRRTGEYIADTRGVGMFCPLKIIEESEER